MAFTVAFALLLLPFSAVEGTFGVQIFGPHFSPFGISQSNGWIGLKSFPSHSESSETLNSEYSHALYPIGKHQYLRIPVKGGLKVVPAPKNLDLFKGTHDYLKHVPLVKKPPLTSFGGYHFQDSSYLAKNSERPLISVPGTGNSIILIHGHPLNHHAQLHTASYLDDISLSGIHSYKPIKTVKSILESYPHSKSHPVLKLKDKYGSSLISSDHKGHSYPSLVYKTPHVEDSGSKHELPHSQHHSIGDSLLYKHKSDVAHSLIPSHHSGVGHELTHVHHSDIEHDSLHDHHSDTEEFLHDHHSDIEHDLSHEHHSDIEHDLSHEHQSEITHDVHDHHSDIRHSLSHGHHSDIAHDVHDHHSDIAHEVHDHHSDIAHDVHDHHSDVTHHVHGHHSNIAHDVHDHHSIAHDVHDHHSDIAHDIHDHHADIEHDVHDHHSDTGHDLSHEHHSDIGHDLSHEHHSDIAHDVQDRHSDIEHDVHDRHSDIEHDLSHNYHSDIEHSHHSFHDSDHSNIHDDDEDDEEEDVEEHGLDIDEEHDVSSHAEEEHNTYAKKIRDYKLLRLAKKILKPIAKTEEKIEEKPTEEETDKNSKKKFPPSKYFKNYHKIVKQEKIEDIEEKVMESMKEKIMEKMKEEIMKNMKEEMVENLSKKMMEKMKEEMIGGIGEKLEEIDEETEEMDEKIEEINDNLDHVPIPRRPNIKFANPSYIPRETETGKYHKREDTYKIFHKIHHKSPIIEREDIRKLYDKYHVHRQTNLEESHPSHPYIPKILSHEVVKYSGGRHPVRPVHKYVEQTYYTTEQPQKAEDVEKEHKYFHEIPVKVEQQEQLQEEDYKPKFPIKTKSDSFGNTQSHSYRESQRSKHVRYEYKPKISLPRGRSKIYRNYEQPRTSSYAVEIQHSRRHGNAKKDATENYRLTPKKTEVDRHERQQKENDEEDFDYLESQLSFTEESLAGKKFGDKLRKE
ncbi:uncharacterized protein LOC129958685 [Argiope bruennichi]|nr:uncharacterized protein LOC129958685 [Argiope bruennichi]